MIESILASAPPRATPWFYRTSAGAEIDLVLELAPKRLAAFEIKRSTPAGAPANFKAACDDIGADHRFIVFPGAESYPLGAGVKALARTDISKVVSTLR